MDIMTRIATLILLAACAFQAQAQSPRVWLDTNFGPIIIELDEAAAPVTVDNFLRYVDDGFYDGIVFHRVDDGFVIQGGGFNQDLVLQDPTYETIENEADNGLSNTRGTVAMARTSEPDSAATQFFFNLANNDFLDPGGNTEAGYAVFGEVVVGMSTIEAIESLPTSSISVPTFGTLSDFPRNTPVIRRAARTEAFPLMADHSGSWYDPSNSGVGFNVEIANNSAGQGPIAIVYWYNFDEQRQFWLTGQASFEWGASEVTIDLFSHAGDAEGTGFQSPPESAFSDYGTLTLRFDDCNNGSFSYEMPAFGSGVVDVTRLSRPEGFVCRDQ